jgi:hypothetical protein
MEKLNIRSTAYPVNQPAEQEWLKEFSVGCRIPKKVEHVHQISYEKYLDIVKTKFITAESLRS